MLNQKGAIQFVVLGILLLGIVGGVFLVTQGNPLKLFTRATTPPIVFKATDGSSLPSNNSGISLSSSPNVRVELTSTLGPPVGTGPSAPVSGPNNRRTVSYKIAEDPGSGLNSAPSQPYTTEPTVINYTFENPSLGQKFIWVEFKASDGSIDRRTAQIEIVNPSTSGPIPPSSTPTPTPTVSPTPTPTPTPTPVPPTSGGGGGSRSTPTPAPRVIKEFRYAENPNDIESLDWKPYTVGQVVSHTFSDSLPGTKFIFVQFRDDRGDLVLINGQRYITSSIELISEQPTPTPTPAEPTSNIPAPLASDSPNCPIENPSNYDIGTLYKMCSVDQLARFDLKWLVDFPNEILIDIGRRKGDLGGFLANFSGERLIGAPPYSGSGFSLEILKQLPQSRIQQLPGYIQDQLK